MSDPTSLSAAAAAEAVHAGELDPRELFAAYRDRAGADELNAFTWVADEPPEWAYNVVGNFNRDALAARRWLLEPPY